MVAKVNVACSAHCAENDIDSAGVRTIRICCEGPDRKVGQAISVDVTNAGNADSGKVVGVGAEDAKATLTQVVQLEVGHLIRISENHVRSSRPRTVRLSSLRSNQYVIQTIAVQIASAGDGKARYVTSGLAEDAEASLAQVAQIHLLRRTRSAKDNVARAGIGLSDWIGIGRTDDHVT